MNKRVLFLLIPMAAICSPLSLGQSLRDPREPLTTFDYDMTADFDVQEIGRSDQEDHLLVTVDWWHTSTALGMLEDL